MTDTKTYLGDRKLYFGASDMPAMRGNSAFTTREQLIAKKRGDLGSFIEDTHFIDRGNEYEDVVFTELEQYWAENGAVEAHSQKTFIDNALRAKCHLDGYFIEYKNSKVTVHIYEIKSKTVDTKTDFQDLADGFKANPPIEYLDQMEQQYMLTKLSTENEFKNTPGVVDVEYKMHLIMGLFRGKSKQCTGTIEIDVTDIIEKTDFTDLSAEIINFWQDVKNHDGNYSPETMLEIARVKAKTKFNEEQAKKEYDDIKLDDNNESHLPYIELCHKYNVQEKLVSDLDKNLKGAKEKLKELTSDIIKATSDVSSIDCGTFTIKIDRKVNNGTYSKAKEASYKAPERVTTLKITRLTEE